MNTETPNHQLGSRWLGPDIVLPQLRAAAIDLDGTLLTSEHRISAATRTAVKTAQEAGLLVVLASSRAPAAMHPLLEDLGLLAPAVFVASQGGLTASYTADGKLQILSRHPSPLEEARKIVDAARALDLTVNWFAGARWLASCLDVQVLREAGIIGSTPELDNLDGLVEGPEKVMFMVAAHETDKLARLSAMLPDTVNTQMSNPTYLEVTGQGIEKASALGALCRQWFISPDELVAFGDGPNDLALFAYAGTSIAPLNACPTVLAAATLVTASNDDDGVALALAYILTNNERHKKP